MKSKKILIALLMFFLIMLSACGSDNSPRNLWNEYIKAMNSRDLEAVAEVYYPKGTPKYEQFLEENDPETYFDFDYVKTVDFYTELSNPDYFCADITIEIDDDYKQFYIYFQRNVAKQWTFISEVNITTDDPSLMGNKADNNYYNSIVKTYEDYKYKYVYSGTPGSPRAGDYIRIAEPLKNKKVVEIPSEIEGVPVIAIGDYAFYHSRKILMAFTISTSKMEELIIPNTVERIEDFAFYQSRKLKTLELPESLKHVGNYAFASCTSLETLTINVDESSLYGGRISVIGKDSMQIDGDAKIYVGDEPNYQVNGAEVTWSVDNEAIATIDETGKLTALGPGTVKITATNKKDNALYSQAIILVQPAPAKESDKNNDIEPLEVTYSYEPIIIKGATDILYKGDYAALGVDGFSSGDIIWESNNANVRIHQYDGKVLVLDKSDFAVTITARSTRDSNIYGTVSFLVRDVTPRLVFMENALDRLNGLKEIYMNVINPHSVEFKGSLKLRSDVKIYVPAQNYEAYLHFWSDMKNNIYPME